jgi:hypothetical protein
MSKERIRSPYTLDYFNHQIKRAEELILQGKYKEAGLEVLCEYNNYRSGWTEDVDDLYHSPVTPEEQVASDKMTDIIKRILGGMLEKAVPTEKFRGFTDLEFVAGSLYKLGENAPRELIDKTRDLLDRSYALGAPKKMLLITPAWQLLDELEKNFKPH